MSSEHPVTGLVTRARTGDKQAWDALVERYAPLIWSICRRYQLDGADAADVSQNVWLHQICIGGVMSVPQAPALDGVHHLKLPVADLDRSLAWYQTRLGYQLQAEIIEGGTRMGLGLRHPNGGLRLAPRLDPGRARAAAGFDYFSIGVPDKQAIDQLAARLTALGEQHAGVHLASIGWILPYLHDPDGHEVRFYTSQHHTERAPDAVSIIHDPRETAERRQREGDFRGP
jgi:catechol 2,3-dioxygenase-like lactoylglutathione lyase family enzyme